MENIQYIHCPKCNGIIKNGDGEPKAWGEIWTIDTQYPKCSECHTEYEITIVTNRVMKIKITERGVDHK